MIWSTAETTTSVVSLQFEWQRVDAELPPPTCQMKQKHGRIFKIKMATSYTLTQKPILANSTCRLPTEIDVYCTIPHMSDHTQCDVQM